MKNPMTQAGIEPANFRFVAQHHKHCATLPRSPKCLWYLRNVNQHNALLLNQYFNSNFVFYMFRTSYVHHQEEYIANSALYGIFSTRLCKQSTWFKNVLEAYDIRSCHRAS